MNQLQLVGFKATVMELLSSGQRKLAHHVLENRFKECRTLAELDVVGELSLKTEHRDLHLKCAETAHSLALTFEEKRASRVNLISAYNTMNQPEKALTLIEVQLSQTPDDFDMLCHKAANLSLMNEKQKSEKILDELLTKYPNKAAQLECMLSGRMLRQGQLAKGVAAFIETHKPTHALFEKQLNMKRWNGIPRPGTTVYVDGEGGIGDEIINIRFFEKIKKYGMNPVLFSPNNQYHRDKNNLFRRHGIEILSESYTVDTKAVWVPMMSLPAVLNLTENDLWTGTYLKPLRSDKNKLTRKKFKIGIKCSGNPWFAQDEYRKIPLELMLKYLPEDADLYYIDVEKVDHPRITSLSDRIHSWEDTLNFIDQMDCIVSSCTSLVHAAGAIGKTTFVAVPIAEYYVWTSSRTDHSTPWYGNNFHVMKQQKLRDWDEPLNEIYQNVMKLKEQHNG